ncbi:hypothetical protein CEXT_83471 [Caerostris extrusa]|uniref:Uncharacterized protein n=1 Tax=Caerostris extrusa TaxID=172846 RepID=A0AAV4Q6W2_CAEEX|nr:hypothetical protein CEXT_83471 [Caerostris extrusa]
MVNQKYALEGLKYEKLNALSSFGTTQNASHGDELLGTPDGVSLGLNHGNAGRMFTHPPWWPSGKNYYHCLTKTKLRCNGSYAIVM